MPLTDLLTLLNLTRHALAQPGLPMTSRRRLHAIEKRLHAAVLWAVALRLCLLTPSGMA